MAGNGSTQLRASAARLRAAGERQLMNQMRRQLRVAAQDVLQSLHDQAIEDLPKAGGLNEFVANQKPKIAVRTTGRMAGVYIRSKVPGNYTNTGRWRHPVYSADRTRWMKRGTSQSDPAAKDWWIRGAQKATPRAQVEMYAVLNSVALEIMGRGL